MAKKKDIHVVPHGNQWATRKEGSDRVGEVVIHRKDGSIRDSDSYGNDPNPPKDKKH